MKINDFKKLCRDYSSENITSDEPHVSMRCDENSISLDFAKSFLLDANSPLIRITEDRPKVYKLYYKLSGKRELKIVIDLFVHGRINIRTIKILSGKLRVKEIKIRIYSDEGFKNLEG